MNLVERPDDPPRVAVDTLGDPVELASVDDARIIEGVLGALLAE